MSRTEIAMAQGPFTGLARHGPGDGVVVLDVGGKEFRTLRSTIALSPVLAEYVSRAERNQELLNEKVFVDRDPTYFGLILNHLRNQAEGLSHSQFGLNKVLSAKKADAFRSYVQLPSDPKKLRDIFMEARHFQIPELESQACGASTLAKVAAVFSGSKTNPFDLAADILHRMRNALLLFGSLTTAGVGVSQGGTIYTTLFSKPQIAESEENNAKSDTKSDAKPQLA
ncbi:Hypothetical Protein FCC1311_002002 [Hondaea fermentalgiana]|uniref:Potassium channel tetramerisation-type BTB domain-containing protein n=1 Tax=Hondaea fermentalgiana TaxID=2315210 RepID=A0A2R5G7G5_9STRA|nr:Hypothetical Protein FCC1311_002002 [Hondaea fermentalgiana]|eukprot:GBG23981.1 Hypothetical Protein FCC1311_002002 [Hondaea fermentalgiana]